MNKAVSVLIVAILFTSCRAGYRSGIYGAHTPTHIFTSLDNSELTMLQMDISNATNYHEEEINLILRNHLLKCNRGKYGSVNIGMMLYGGMYGAVNTTTNINKSYDYFGIGPEFSATLFLPIGKSKLGYGFHGHLAIEQGSYQNFLANSAETEDANFINPALTGFNFIAYDLAENETAVLQTAINTNNENFSISFAHLIDDFSYSISWSPSYYTGSKIYEAGSFSFSVIQKF